MYKLIAQLFYAINGWKIKGGIPPEIKKCILVGAPHTSNWDFVYGSFAWTLFGFKLNYIIKKEWFRFPFSLLFKSLGGIPVDRSRNTNFVDTMAEVIRNRKEAIILILPEGTRQKVDKWKTGFYYMALKAKVPIVLGKFNYREKIAIVGSAFMPSGNIEKDFEIIREFYKDCLGRNPENFSLESVRP